MAFVLAFVMLFFGGCTFVPPETPSGTITDRDIKIGIDTLLSDFYVELMPWSESGTRARVAITNRTGAAYQWALLHVAFLNEAGGLIKTETAGAYSEILPNGTVYYYTDLPDVNKSTAYVYAVEDNRFINDPEQGITENY